MKPQDAAGGRVFGEAEPLVRDRDSVPKFDHEGKIQWYPLPARLYSRREVLADAAVLSAGCIFSCVAAPVLMQKSATMGDSWDKQVGLATYCVGFLAMFNSSAARNLLGWKVRWARTLVFLDACGIHLIIAGSYTPLCMQSRCYVLLLFVWCCALVGIAAKLYTAICSNGPSAMTVGSHTSTALFLVMGWSIVLEWRRVEQYISPLGALQVIWGGVLASVGVGFWFAGHEFHMPIWHLLVLISSLCIYAFAFGELAGGLPLGTTYWSSAEVVPELL